MTGYIDDDGTSEIRFETQPVFIENRSFVVSLSELLNRLYDIAKELLPDFHERQNEERGREAREAAEQGETPN